MRSAGSSELAEANLPTAALGHRYLTTRLDTRVPIDRRSVRVRLTEKGREIHRIVSELFENHASGMLDRDVMDMKGMEDITFSLRRVERFWSDQIRYIY